MESWKILVRIGAISAAYSFRDQGGMASGPEALFVFNSDSCFATPLMVIDRLKDGTGEKPRSEIGYQIFSQVINRVRENCRCWS